MIIIETVSICKTRCKNLKMQTQVGYTNSCLCTQKGIFPNHIKLAQPIQSKFSHMTFDWNSSAMLENGHCRSHDPPNRGLLCPPPLPRKLTYLRFQPIQTKFSLMTFDWNRSAEFKNRYYKAHVTPTPFPNRGSLPPLKIQIPLILMKGSTNLNQIFAHGF